MNENDKSIKIELDGTQQAYFRGVAAGRTASDQLADVPKETLFEARLQYFWLKVGTELAAAVPDGDPERVAAFIQGAGLRKPETLTPAMVLTITSTDTPAFIEGGEEAEIARILVQTAGRIRNGVTEGELLDGGGVKVGTYRVDLFS
jgi:hypothetical protein